MREAARWAGLTGELLSRGHDAGSALAAAWDHVYARGEASEAARDAAAAAFDVACVPFLDAVRGGGGGAGAGAVDAMDVDADADADDAAAALRTRGHETFLEPLGWPSSPSIARALAAAAGCDASRVARAGALLDAAAAALAARALATSGGAAAWRGASSLSAAALPLRALRRRLALEEEEEYLSLIHI